MPEFHGEIRESIWDYILHNNQRFADHLPQETNEYVQKMLEDGEWGGEPEIVAFSELYNVNITVYDAMISSIPYLATENEKANHTVYILIVNNNHFNTLNVINKSKFSHFQKVKKIIKEMLIDCNKIRKIQCFMGDYSTVYSKNTLFTIKEYLEKNIYPEEITSIDCQKTKKNCNRKMVNCRQSYLK